LKSVRGIYVFIGPPGSGKGSLSKLCVSELGFRQLSTGDLCRQHIKNQTNIGKQIDFTIKSGKLVADGIIIEMVNEWLAEQIRLGRKIILDGYPRNVVQAQTLDVFLKENSNNLDFRVIRLVVSDNVVIERILGRGLCQNVECQVVYSFILGSSYKPKKDMICDICGAQVIRRVDDNQETFLKRLNVYHEYEQGILDFFNKNLRVVNQLNVEKPLDEVFRDFKKLLGLDV